MRTGRNSSAPGGFSFEAIEAFISRLLITLQQLRMQTSLSLGALYMLIFCSSFWASYKNKHKYETSHFHQNWIPVNNSLDTCREGSELHPGNHFKGQGQFEP